MLQYLHKARGSDTALQSYYRYLLPPRLSAQCAHHQSRVYTSSSGGGGGGAAAAAAVSNDAYRRTVRNLAVGRHRHNTRVMFQGFTGKQATVNAAQSIEYGTNIVGGVSPNKAGEHLGLPVYSTVKEAVQYLKPDATSIFVSATHATSAIISAIEAEIPLISAVAEHIPVHDLLRVHSILRTQSKSRLLGPNSPGMIHAPSRCRIGFMPYLQYTPGVVGVVAKSGTLSYEAVASTTRAGLGQSYVIGVGGDALAGTNLREALEVVWEDRDTEGIIVIGEVGGDGELEVVEFLEEMRREGRHMKPVMGLIAGITAPANRTMGHSGAFRSSFGGDISAEEKLKAWQRAGIQTVLHPGQFGEGMKQLLNGAGKVNLGKASHGAQQIQGIHTLRTRRPMAIVPQRRNSLARQYQISPDRVVSLFKTSGIPILSPSEIHKLPTSAYTNFTLSLSISQRHRSPCVTLSSPTASFPQTSLPFPYDSGPDAQLAEAILAHTHLPTTSPRALLDLLQRIHRNIFRDKEAFLIEIDSVIVTADGQLAGIEVGEAQDHGHPGIRVYYDDAAYKSCQRQAKLWEVRDEGGLAAEEVQAAEGGIVYIKLMHEMPEQNDPVVAGAGTGTPYIGCLVNGAGLAMNTNDVLTHHGGYPVNFIDTGGKATAATIKECFRLILLDHRTKAIFVNIFGGLTHCDMIASGIILAFEEYRVQLAGVPVVVRLRGTNEEVGWKMLRESQLPGVYAFSELDEAAGRVIALAAGRS